MKRIRGWQLDIETGKGLRSTLEEGGEKQEHSALASALLALWSHGKLSATMVQWLAWQAVLDGAQHDELVSMAKTGAYGSCPGNCHRDLILQGRALDKGRSRLGSCSGSEDRHDWTGRCHRLPAPCRLLFSRRVRAFPGALRPGELGKVLDSGREDTGRQVDEAPLAKGARLEAQHGATLRAR